MIRYSVRVIVFGAAFCLGLVGVSLLLSADKNQVLNESTSSFTADKNQASIDTASITTETANLSRKVEFKFRHVFKYQAGFELLEFELINGTAEDIQYMGYGKGSYCAVDFKLKNKIKISPGCSGTGLSAQTLKSGESQIFNIWLPEWMKIDATNLDGVGFHLYEADSREQKTIWSDRILN